MKKLNSFIAAAVSAAMVLCPALVYADSAAEEESAAAEKQEEGGSPWWAGLHSFLEEGGEALSGVLGKDGPVSEALNTADAKISEAAGGLLSTFTDENGDFSIDGLLDSLGRLTDGDDGLLGVLGGLLGGGLDFEAQIARSDNMENAINRYIIEKNASAGMESGDVQIVSIWWLDHSDVDANPVSIFACCTQNNFTEDEDHVLRFLCDHTDLILLTLNEAEDGSFAVADAAFAEEGEDYIAAFGGILPLSDQGSNEKYLTETEVALAFSLPYDLAYYLTENPEITGIEYEGEIYSDAGELHKIAADRLEFIYSENEEAESASEPDE